MQVWIKTLIKDRFPIDVSPNEEVSSVKRKVQEHLLKLGVYVPPLQKLVHRGVVLQDNKCLSEVQLENEDYCLFLYDLTAKPKEPDNNNVLPLSALQPQPPSPSPSPSSTNQPPLLQDDRSLIESIVSSFTQSRQTPQTQSTHTQPQTQAQPLSPPPVQPPVVAPWRQQHDAQRSMFMLAQNENLPFPDEESLNLLVSMGFSSRRARKALLLNLFERQMALDWLLAHSGDADIDEPLNEAQLLQIMGTQNRLDQNTLRNNAYNTVPAQQTPQQVHAPPPSRAEAIQNAIRNKICTYKVTGTNFAVQNWYHCFTCGLVDSEGACESCAVVCHAGHVLSEVKSSMQFYCDCGHNAVANNCKCCPK